MKLKHVNPQVKVCGENPVMPAIREQVSMPLFNKVLVAVESQVRAQFWFKIRNQLDET